MTFSKAITPAKGYTYRVVCEHYAEKKRLLILKSKEAEQKLKESCSNFDEEKYLFEDNDAYLIKVTVLVV